MPRKANQALSESTVACSSGDVQELKTNLQYNQKDADKLTTAQAVCSYQFTALLPWT